MDKIPSRKGGNGFIPDLLRSACYWQDVLGKRRDRIEKRVVAFLTGCFPLIVLIMSRTWKP